MTVPPVLVLSRAFLRDVEAKERHVLQKLAVGELPEETRKLFWGLARSRGGEMDEVDDVVETNAIGVSLGGEEEEGHLVVVPEAAVCVVF